MEGKETSKLDTNLAPLSAGRSIGPSPSRVLLCLPPTEANQETPRGDFLPPEVVGLSPERKGKFLALPVELVRNKQRTQYV